MHVDETVKTRQSDYGPYGKGIDLRVALLNLIKESHEAHHGEPLSDTHTQYFWDIFNKVSRLAISPDHLDSWHDIQGYAKIIEQDINERIENDRIQTQSINEVE